VANTPPRIIATTLLRDNVIRYTVALFVFSLLFAVKTLNLIGPRVPEMMVFITGALGMACLATFLFLIDHSARSLRPVSLVKKVGESGLAVIESVYPELFDSTQQTSTAPIEPGSVQLTILHEGTSEIILAIDIEQLLAEAERTGGLIELGAQVGDFVGSGEPLFLLHGDAASANAELLRRCVIFGTERTLEQDPLFGFRILVDIAIKALSAAINDPTTAVLAIDQLHRLLRSAGRRNLRTDSISSADSRPRLLIRTPDWDDFVHLAFAEIRCYGASNVQIARRLRAMIVNLASTLPAERHPALRRQLELLDASLEGLYSLPGDLALARIPDSQGLGGSTEATTPRWAR
jgi:uncharacterized membrane protein